MLYPRTGASPVHHPLPELVGALRYLAAPRRRLVLARPLPQQPAVRQERLRRTQGDPERTAVKLGALALSETVARELAPLVAFLEPINVAIADADRRPAPLARERARRGCFRPCR